MMRRAIEHLCLMRLMLNLFDSKAWWIGLRKVEDRAAFAFHASWHEAQKTAKEVWARPIDQPEKYVSQKEASFDFDQKVHEALVAGSDIRGQQRFRRNLILVDLSLQYLLTKTARIVW